MKFIFIILSSFIIGCTAKIYPTEYENAQNLCEKHDGLNYLEEPDRNLTFYILTAVCNDDSSITKRFERLNYDAKR